MVAAKEKTRENPTWYPKVGRSGKKCPLARGTATPRAVLFDIFIKAIKSGDILQDNVFGLLERRGDKIVAVKYQGVWIE